MSWIARSLPPEPELDASPPATPLEMLEAERLQLISAVCPRVRTARQVRIREQISRLTVEILKLQRTRS